MAVPSQQVIAQAPTSELEVKKGKEAVRDAADVKKRSEALLDTQIRQIDLEKRDPEKRKLRDEAIATCIRILLGDGDPYLKEQTFDRFTRLVKAQCGFSAQEESFYATYDPSDLASPFIEIVRKMAETIYGQRQV